MIRWWLLAYLAAALIGFGIVAIIEAFAYTPSR